MIAGFGQLLMPLVPRESYGMKRHALLCLCVIYFGAVAVADDPDAPLPAADAAATAKMPEGFKVTVLASEPDIQQPIGFCMDDRGRLWVAEAYSYPVHSDEQAKDRIVILEDTDGDGKHDKRVVFYEGLNYITGIEYGFGGVWVMTPPYFYFIPDRDGDDRPDSSPQLLLDGFGNHDNAHNLANGFAWGPDGWLYGTHGRTNWSMIGKPDTDDSQRERFDGGVYRYHPTRHVWEPYADGTTNPWGIDWNDYGHAFVCNCVNPHLFQVIQGAHYEPWRGRKSSQHAYQRIDTIADHLHFTGLSNIRKGVGSAEEDAAGGGHAHCGTMIYLGDSFPENYRNTLFTNNVHGRRINNDVPRRSGSGYIASHGPDLMRATDPWFMGVTLAYGPSGEVYVSDWSDTGECHSKRNTRRETGRIYRITWGKTRLPTFDLGAMSNAELAELQLHKNDWQVRHARRILQERAAAGDDMSEVHRRLHEILKTESRVPKKLRALWALHVLDGLDDDFLLDTLSHESEDVRSWAITLFCEQGSPPAAARRRFVELARNGDSPLVRLSLASALQRFALPDRWELATALAARREDRSDPNLPLMIWYACEPLITNDLAKFASLGANAAIPRVRINVARRIADSSRANEGLEKLAQHLAEPIDDAVSHDLLTGILEGIEGNRKLSMPANWRRAFDRLSTSGSANVQEQIVRLAVAFKDREALETLRIIANNPKSSADDRKRAVDALVGQRVKGFEKDLLALLGDDELRSSALRGLASYDSPTTPAVILSHYANMNVSDRQDAQLTLASRRSWARALLNAIEQKQIDATDMTAYCVRQIQSLNDTNLNASLSMHWGGLRETSNDKAKQIRSIKNWLSDKKLDQADMVRGEQLFTKHCASCHQLFGKGGKIGPDITGAQRHNLDYMLENIVDPSAAVAKDYQMEALLTVDGRAVTGLIASETEQTLTVQTVNERLVFPVGDIEERRKSKLSIMPDGLLDPLSENEVRDLMGYLRNRN